MKKLIVLIAIFTFLNNVNAQNRSIQFETKTWVEILQKAKIENKIIFLDAYTSWCSPCKWMSNVVFTSDTVADFYNQNFVCAKIDMEKGEGVDLAKKYNVSSYPSFLFINSDGVILNKSIGGRPATEFIKLGKESLNTEEQIPSYVNRFNAGDLSLAFIKKYLEKLYRAEMETSEILDKYTKSIPQIDLIKRENWTLLNTYLTNCDSDELKYVISNYSKFIEIYTKDSVDNFIEGVYLTDIYKSVYIKEINEVLFNETKIKIQNSAYVNTDYLLLYADFEFNYKKNNGEKCLSIANEMLDKKYLNNKIALFEGVINTIYQKIDDKTKIENFKKKVIESGIEGGEKFCLLGELDLFASKSDWANYFITAELLITKYFSTDNNFMNTVAWTCFEKIDDKNNLEKALSWSKKSNEQEEIPAFIDTYANLLYKLGKKEEAIIQSTKALELTRKANGDVESYEETLNKMKAGK